jgi:hypothetical protein
MSQLNNISKEDIADINEIMNFKQLFIGSLKQHKIVGNPTAKDLRAAFITAVQTMRKTQQVCTRGGAR